MKTFLMTSAAAAVLTLGLAAPAAADCAAELASLKQETFTGSVNPAATTTAGATTDAGTAAATTPAPETAANAPAATGTEVPAAATGTEPSPDQMAAAAPSADQSGTAGMSPEQTAAMESAATEAGKAAPAEGTAGAVPGTEATAAMNEATEGIATSPEEVEGQQTAQPAETAPSAEQIAAADEPLTPSANPTSGGQPIDLNAEMLARAEAYQKLGNEDACMNVVEQAKAIQ